MGLEPSRGAEALLWLKQLSYLQLSPGDGWPNRALIYDLSQYYSEWTSWAQQFSWRQLVFSSSSSSKKNEVSDPTGLQLCIVSGITNLRWNQNQAPQAFTIPRCKFIASLLMLTLSAYTDLRPTLLWGIPSGNTIRRSILEYIMPSTSTISLSSFYVHE